MNEFNVTAFDPGGTTGYAVGRIGPDGRLYYEHSDGERYTQYAPLWGMLCSLNPLYVIAESFEFRKGKQRHGIVLESRNILGVLQLWCELHNSHFCLQSPAVGKAFVTDAQLRKRGIYKVGNDHANDATRHLLRWYLFGEGGQFRLNYKQSKNS